jgi:hypothetical protein
MSNRNQWRRLRALIELYKVAAIREAEKGGGDPEVVPVLEAELKLEKARLDYHIRDMERTCDCQPRHV